MTHTRGYESSEMIFHQSIPHRRPTHLRPLRAMNGHDPPAVSHTTNGSQGPTSQSRASAAIELSERLRTMSVLDRTTDAIHTRPHDREYQKLLIGGLTLLTNEMAVQRRLTQL